jgi:hypothetical protein
MNQFERLQQFANLQKAPPVKFKDLEAMITSKITFNVLPIKVRTDFVRITNATVMTYITIQMDKKDLQFKEQDGISKAMVNMYARITSMSRRPVNVFEEPTVVEVPTELLPQAINTASIYQKAVPLAPGMYRLNVVVKDVVGGNMNNYEVALNVPRYEEEKLASSSLVLADVIEKVPTKSIGTGQFVIGTSKVRPRMDETFKRSEKMGIYTEFYNFTPDEKTQKPSGTIEYAVLKSGSNETVFEHSENVDAIPGSSAQQVKIEKLLPLSGLEPGEYTLKIKVTDKNSNQSLTPSVTFTVT